MITLIHGDLVDASRAELVRLKAAVQGKDIRQLDGRTIDETNLTQALESHSLFGGETVVFIEQLFGKLGKKLKLINSLAAILLQAGSQTDIFLWEDKEVGATVVKSLGNPVVKLYKTPQVLFQFLDGIAPGRAGVLLPTYAKLLETNVAEIVFAMIIRRVRQLIQLRDGVSPEGLAAWQVGRLTAQARLFTIEKLVAMHSALTDIDIAVKMGASPFNLAKQIELFIINI